MDGFEAANPGIKVKLVSGPFSATHDQIVAGAASGTLSDVVGLDGAWVNELAKQGAIAPMDSMMDETKFDRSQMADIIKVDGKSYMFPLASFVYPVFVNLDMAKAAGVDKLPSTRTEFADAAKKMTHADKNQYGWVLPLSLQVPNGAQNDVMSWVWASGQSMLKDGKPNVDNPAVVDVPHLHQVAERRRRHLARHQRQEGAGQARRVRQRPRRHDDPLARPPQPDARNAIRT